MRSGLKTGTSKEYEPSSQPYVIPYDPQFKIAWNSLCHHLKVGTVLSIPQGWCITYLYSKTTSFLKHLSAFSVDALKWYFNNWANHMNSFLYFFNSKILKLRSTKTCWYITPLGVRHFATTYSYWEWGGKITVTDVNLFLNIWEQATDNQTDKLKAMRIAVMAWKSSKAALLSGW